MQKKVPNKKTLKYQELTKNLIPKLGSDRYIFMPNITLILPHKIYDQLQKLFMRLFMRRKDVENTSHVL